MSFLVDIFSQLEAAADTSILQELHNHEATGKVSWWVTGLELLKQITQARKLLATKDLKHGERVAHKAELRSGLQP